MSLKQGSRQDVRLGVCMKSGGGGDGTARYM